MNIKEVKDLINEILQSDISEFELEHTGTRVRLRRGLSQHNGSDPGSAVLVSSGNPIDPPQVADAPPAGAMIEAEGSERDNGLHYVTSPIVGTFYRSPAPGADPFVKIGATVDEGSTLCIVEAMKLMNEIPSDVAGEIVEIYAENGHAVEYGQRLFGLRARG